MSLKDELDKLIESKKQELKEEESEEKKTKKRNIVFQTDKRFIGRNKSFNEGRVCEG